MARLYLCVSALLSLTLAQSTDSFITCYGFGNWEYNNNTACPGSDACCGSGATCISNRLCHNPEDGPETFVRAPCQVEDFGFESCPQICRQDEDGGILPRVTRCRNGSFCCVSDTGCCSDGRGTFLNADGLVLQSSPKSTIIYTSWGPERTEADFRTDAPSATDTDFTSATDISTTTGRSTGSSAAPTPTNTDSNKDGNDENEQDGGSRVDAMKVGLGAGISVGVIAIGGTAAFFFWRRKKMLSQQRQELEDPWSTQRKPDNQEPWVQSTIPARTPSKSPNVGIAKPWQSHAAVELDGDGYPNRNEWHELDGTGR